MRRNTIDIVTLGCSKNLVDTERLMAMLQEAGYEVTHDAENPNGETAVINTCGFIGDAKEESVNMILRFAQAKSEGRLKRLFVMGCLSERYRNELKAEIPEVDKFYGKFDWTELLHDLGKTLPSNWCGYERKLTTPPHYAYVKISEGCNRHCSYCAIPLITGSHVSRPMEEILKEVEMLVAKGVKEFQIIAQELTFYGRDLYKKPAIADLVDRMADIPGVEWVRLHYAYPSQFPLDLLRVIRERPNVCSYLDMALQHISDHMLTLMQRHITREETYRLIETMRREVPGICLRTTLMVGYPGETEQDFEELKQFVRDAHFDRMGVFTYSEEEGTYAATHYADQIPQEVKTSRQAELMKIQEEWSLENNTARIGQVMKVIIDREEAGYYVGRTEFDSPEVDQEVLIEKGTHKLLNGQFYPVEVTGAEAFDLYGRVALQKEDSEETQHNPQKP